MGGLSIRDNIWPFWLHMFPWLDLCQIFHKEERRKSWLNDWSTTFRDVQWNSSLEITLGLFPIREGREVSAALSSQDYNRFYIYASFPSIFVTQCSLAYQFLQIRCSSTLHNTVDLPYIWSRSRSPLDLSPPQECNSSLDDNIRYKSIHKLWATEPPWETLNLLNLSRPWMHSRGKKFLETPWNISGGWNSQVRHLHAQPGVVCSCLLSVAGGRVFPMFFHGGFLH